MRIDEISRQELRESQATMNEFTPNTEVARKSEPHERLWGVLRCRISLQWKIITRSQLTGSCSKSSWSAEPRPKPAT